ncbi:MULTISPECIES: DUF4854 domain-containing protein [Caproicibacterium]|uniref:DUF4854 domain-containing protein n=1 Tax=Caproicibacterium argilliputei TaxID=3030016 RepID=A0AA97DCX0_9FIRM|nr:DUF4854 domain-containing protein [Caproicibacterium argilliputei]WOC33190.1 DUF4854 domain-containing protein [Caproicibacterium argilliputei]
MKKLVKSITLTALAAALMLSVTACGGAASQTDSSTSAVSSQTSSAAAENSSAATSAKDNAAADDAKAEFDSIEAYVNSDEMQSQISEMVTKMSKQGMDIKITGKDNKLIYTYTFQKGLDISKEDLAPAIDEQKSTFTSVAAALKMAVHVDNPVVVVSYRNADGSEIISREFQAS